MGRADVCSMMIMIVFFLAFASIFPRIHGHIAEFDEFWQKRAAEAWNRTLESYEAEPAKIVSHLNVHANRVLKEMSEQGLVLNSTRRNLKGERYAGPCMVTNPIDRCWRCQANWESNRFRLSDCGLGFGHKAKGGKNGRIYVVTDSSDNDMVNPKPGTLRHAVIQPEPLWIIFSRSMVIRLSQELMVTSDKTIDGRGVKVHIAYGAGITLQFVKNVIIHGLYIHNIVQGSGGLIRDSVNHYGLRTMSDGDGISIFGSQDIWVDHVSMKKCYDGLIDAIQGSTGITVSNCHFTDHNEAMLFGASDSYSPDAKMQITVAFNHFGKRIIQRMPRCRWGYIHIVNNDYTHWNMYAIGGSKGPTIISQGNRYIARPLNVNANAQEVKYIRLPLGHGKTVALPDVYLHPKMQVTKREYAPESEWKSWTWRSQGDLFMRGAYFVESGDADYMSKHPERYDLLQPAAGTQVGDITKFAGALPCKKGIPC